MKCWSLTALLAASVLAGCRSYDPEHESGWHDPYADIPAGAIPQPVGSLSSGWYSKQATLAGRDDFVIYQYEWQAENQLSPFGQRHFEGLVDRLNSEPEQILVETSGNSELDAKRRELLVTALAKREVPTADQRVIVSYPVAEGLDGREAQRASMGYFGSGQGAGGLTGNGQNALGGAGGINTGTGGIGGGSTGFGF